MVWEIQQMELRNYLKNIQLQCRLELHVHLLNVLPVKVCYFRDFETGRKVKRHKKQSIEVREANVF